MKKVYLFSTMILFSGFGFAQRANMPKAANPTEVKPERNLNVNQSSNYNAGSRSSRAVLWQDDFSVPANWTMTNSGNPSADWSIGTSGPSGAGGYPIAAINSTTAANGFALFDSDGFGSTSSVQDASITTVTPIDLSLYPAVVIEFEQFYRKYKCNTYVQVSNDNGTTWTSYEVNAGLDVNASTPNPDFAAVNISSSAGGQASVLIRFNFVGGWDYAWMVDDIQIVEAEDHELILGSVFYGEYSKYPVGQQLPVEFSGEITNMGGTAQTNVSLNAKVNTTLFDGSSAVVSSFAVGLVDTLEVATPTQIFTPSAVGSYSVLFNIIQDSTDVTPGNNTKTRAFEVSDTTFSRDNNNYTGSGSWNQGDAYELANLFEVSAPTYATSVSVVLQGNSIADGEIRVKLYEIDAAGDFVEMAVSDFYVIKSTDIPAAASTSPVSVTVPFISPVQIPAGAYLAAVEHVDPTKALVIAVGTDIVQPILTSFIYDTPTATWYYTSSTPMIRMNVDATVGINNLAKSEPGNKLSQNKPNPAQNSTVVEFHLASESAVSLTLFDITGKTVMNVSGGRKAAGDHRMNLDLSNIPSGVYWYSLNTDNSVLTNKMIIVK